MLMGSRADGREEGAGEPPKESSKHDEKPRKHGLLKKVERPEKALPKKRGLKEKHGANHQVCKRLPRRRKEQSVLHTLGK